MAKPPRLGLGLLPVPACAFVAHAALYRSLWPVDGRHGYFGWYEPLVLALTGAALVAVLALLALAAAARAFGRPLPAARGRVAPAAPRLAATTLAFLLVQESLERSLHGSLAFASFTPAQWLTLLAAVVLSAAVLGTGLRLLERAAVRLLAGPRPRVAAPALGAPWSVRQAVVRRARPLAERRALRGPPGVVAC
jgi:hypothetical protein